MGAVCVLMLACPTATRAGEVEAAPAEEGAYVSQLATSGIVEQDISDSALEQVRGPTCQGIGVYLIYTERRRWVCEMGYTQSAGDGSVAPCRAPGHTSRLIVCVEAPSARGF